MGNPVEKATRKAIETFGEGAVKEYLRLMSEEERLCSSRREESERNWYSRIGWLY